MKMGKDLWNQVHPRHMKKYVVHTGVLGRIMFHDAVRKQSALMLAKSFLESSKLVLSEYESILAMLDGHDEDIILAETILEGKLENYG